MLVFQKQVGCAVVGVNTDAEPAFTIVLEVGGERMELSRYNYDSLVEAIAQLEISLDQGRKLFSQQNKT